MGLRSNRTPLAAVALALVVVGAALGAERFEERSLGSIPEDVELVGVPVFAREGARVAYVGRAEEGQVVVVDGARGETMEFADSPVFSADGKRVAYRIGERAGKDAERWWVVVDGVRQKPFSWCGEPVFSADARNVAYWAADNVKRDAETAYRGGSYFVVVGGRKSDEYLGRASAEPPVLSPDGKRAGFVALKGNHFVAVVGKEESRPYTMVGAPAFGPGGKTYVYPVMTKLEEWQLLNDREASLFRHAEIMFPVFSPSGTLAYCAREPHEWFVVVDGVRQPGEFGAVGPPVFDTSSQRVAYPANEGGSWSLPRIGGIPSTIQHHATERRRVLGGEWFIVSDGSAGPRFDEVTAPVFSSRGAWIAYAGRRGDKWVAVAGGESSEAYDFVSPPIFNEEGTQIGFGVRAGRELRWKVMELTED